MDTTTDRRPAVPHLAPEAFAERAAAGGRGGEGGRGRAGARQTLTAPPPHPPAWRGGAPGLGKTMLVRTIADVITAPSAASSSRRT